MSNQRIVVTGAGNGIGRAIARRMAAEGAKVVVNDLDAAAAQAVADEIGGMAWGGDAASEAGVAALIEAATAHLGEIDIFFANAGIEVGVGLDASEADWQRSMDVNVMAHIRAARLLVPGWLERGHGRFVVTASAAGLLMMLGSAPYSVSKHSAVAFAEWLSATYGNRGIVVQAICPQGVRTRMLEDAGPIADILIRDAALEPEDVAESVWQALQGDQFLILPHLEVADYYVARAATTDTWLRGMRKLQGRLDAFTG
jgi:NAD(P)-dependent dehydrogenase (short-subunit alcohol dehydrogenase family)